MNGSRLGEHSGKQLTSSGQQQQVAHSTHRLVSQLLRGMRRMPPPVAAQLPTNCTPPLTANSTLCDGLTLQDNGKAVEGGEVRGGSPGRRAALLPAWPGLTRGEQGTSH